MVLAKWTKMQSAAKVNIAADSAQREAKFRKGLRREATNLQHNMDADQFKQFYTQQALDRRCELRHTPEVIRSLRAWSRAVEFKERCLTGSSVIVVHEAMYVDALTKCALSLTAAPTGAALREAITKDWKRDSKRKPTMSFERFKDSLFELADTWVETISPQAYARFLWTLLQCVCRSDNEDPMIFLDDNQIRRGIARPTTAEAEDPLEIKLREKQDDLEEARERREAAKRLQQRQRQRKLEREAEARRLQAEAMAIEARARRQAAMEERQRREEELAAALKQAAIGKHERDAAMQRAAIVLEERRVAQQSHARQTMRALGLLPAPVSPRDGRTLHLEESGFAEARGWLPPASWSATTQSNPWIDPWTVGGEGESWAGLGDDGVEEDAAWLLESCEKAASSFVEYALPEARAMTAEHQRLKQVMGSLGVKPPLRGHDYGKDMLNRVLASASATTPRNSEGQRSPRSPRPPPTPRGMAMVGRGNAAARTMVARKAAWALSEHLARKPEVDPGAPARIHAHRTIYEHPLIAGPPETIHPPHTELIKGVHSIASAPLTATMPKVGGLWPRGPPSPPRSPRHSPRHRVPPIEKPDGFLQDFPWRSFMKAAEEADGVGGGRRGPRKVKSDAYSAEAEVLSF